MEKKSELLKQESSEILITKEQQFYEDVRLILQRAREEAYNSANSIMTYAYWNVGRRIVEQEQYGETKTKYGSYLIKNLSEQLSDEFGTGFSMANLRNCRQFYLVFPKDSYGFSMAGKISWSHLRSIMRISDEEERNFYLKETLTENWSVRALERNIKSGYYKRMLSTQLPDKENRALEFVKDPFVLEFMGITPNIDQLESDLETTIINNLQKFLLEMGKGFKEGNRFQTLLGVTGSGKTFTMANVIAALNKPTLVIAHNKTLAGQLYGEFKEFFPENAAEYFVS